jgi:hypothetical protein
MNKFILAILLLLPVLAWSSNVSSSDPNPADYAITVHVASTRMLLEGNPPTYAQQLSVIINGKKYELECTAVNSLLALGDYKAKLVKDDHRSPYDSYQVYEFLFPDNKTRKFLVVGQSE